MRLIKGLQGWQNLSPSTLEGIGFLRADLSANKDSSEKIKDSIFSASSDFIYVTVIIGSYSFKINASPIRLSKTMN